MAKSVDILKQLQADSIVFFVKLHNYHWNVKGMEFQAVHAATEEIYETFAGIFDDLAERAIQLGGTPYVTLAEMTKAAKIKEEKKVDFKSKFVVEAIKADYEYFLKAFLSLSEAASKEGDGTTAGWADEQVGHLQKAIWMLNAQLS